MGSVENERAEGHLRVEICGRWADRQNREEGGVGVQSSNTLDKGVKPFVV